MIVVCNLLQELHMLSISCKIYTKAPIPEEPGHTFVKLKSRRFHFRV